ncbi:MAG: crossover junction endodeoxyribonuclease RuvC [Candidatus Pacebacteria bacterium]|nr:crossover junction endodeoxyribonuclease RuvC [Candidatus Paceibacterota bacterium]
MKVLAFDPGYDRLGVAVIERQYTKDILLHSSCLETDKKSELPDRLLLVGNEVTKLIEEYTPDAIAIETIFFNKNTKTAIGVAQARGIIIFLAKNAGCKVYEYGPQEIKVAVTGYGKSDKAAVIDMVKRLIVGAPEEALDDEYDAIAVGITALAHNRK